MSLEIVLHTDGTCTAAAMLSASTWRDDEFDFWAFDRHADDLAARGEPLHVTAPPDLAIAIAHELAIRVQRLAAKRNAATRDAWFARVLVAHRALHDLDKPLVRADLDHAHDTWQWALRLAPTASAAIQLAALLHDIERLASEAEARNERPTTDYQTYKDAHARAGADLAQALFARAGVPEVVAREACELVAHHERAGDTDALRMVNDADALSFFSLNSAGYLAYFGAELTWHKVAYTFARMSPPARAWLPKLRLPRVIRCQLEEHDQRA